MGSFIVAMIIIGMISGPCIVSYMLGKRAGFNDALRIQQVNQSQGINWNFRTDEKR